VTFETVDLVKAPPDAAELAALFRKLGLRPRDLLRTKDPAYEELGLDSGKHSDAQLLELMAAHPGLIQRPIAVRGRKAVVARPVERLADLLD
jgi:arsenate reductase